MANFSVLFSISPPDDAEFTLVICILRLKIADPFTPYLILVVLTKVPARSHIHKTGCLEMIYLEVPIPGCRIDRLSHRPQDL